MARVKICGLTTPEAVDAALSAQAFALGFVFCEKSPRHLTLDQAANLVGRVPISQLTTAVFVNPTDEQVMAVRRAVPVHSIQLHGEETPERVAALSNGAARGMQIIKAVPVASRSDLIKGYDYKQIATMVLFDAKVPQGSSIPGGLGLRFDWELLRDFNSRGLPWGLAGGLDPSNVAEAIDITRTDFVDTSSGVESAPGIKDPAKIAAFCAAAR